MEISASNDALDTLDDEIRSTIDRCNDGARRLEWEYILTVRRKGLSSQGLFGVPVAAGFPVDLVCALERRATDLSAPGADPLRVIVDGHPPFGSVFADPAGLNEQRSLYAAEVEGQVLEALALLCARLITICALDAESSQDLEDIVSGLEQMCNALSPIHEVQQFPSGPMTPVPGDTDAIFLDRLGRPLSTLYCTVDTLSSCSLLQQLARSKQRGLQAMESAESALSAIDEQSILMGWAPVAPRPRSISLDSCRSPLSIPIHQRKCSVEDTTLVSSLAESSLSVASGISSCSIRRKSVTSAVVHPRHPLDVAGATAAAAAASATDTPLWTRVTDLSGHRLDMPSDSTDVGADEEELVERRLTVRDDGLVMEAPTPPEPLDRVEVPLAPRPPRSRPSSGVSTHRVHRRTHSATLSAVTHTSSPAVSGINQRDELQAWLGPTASTVGLRKYTPTGSTAASTPYPPPSGCEIDSSDLDVGLIEDVSVSHLEIADDVARRLAVDYLTGTEEYDIDHDSSPLKSSDLTSGVQSPLSRTPSGLMPSPAVARSPLSSQLASASSRLGPTPSLSVQARPVVTSADFVPVKYLSKGAFGTVLLVRKAATSDLFAMKVLTREHVVRKNQVERVRLERDILAKTPGHSRHIVDFFFSFVSDEHLFLVLEFVSGGDLASLLDLVGSLGEDLARFYLAEIALALDYLHHQLKVIHRDIKPENILLTAEGHCKLTDFGLSSEAVTRAPRQEKRMPVMKRISSVADILEAHGELSDSIDSVFSGITAISPPRRPSPLPEEDHVFSLVGTPYYLAPELINGEDHTMAADWWSFGVLAFELLCGYRPFSGATESEVMENILNMDLDDLLPHDEEGLAMAGLTADGADLIRHFLVRDPEERTTSLSTIKEHPFFRSVRWDTIYSENAPYIPPPVDLSTEAQGDAGEWLGGLLSGAAVASANNPFEAPDGFKTAHSPGQSVVSQGTAHSDTHDLADDFEFFSYINLPALRHLTQAQVTRAMNKRSSRSANKRRRRRRSALALSSGVRR